MLSTYTWRIVRVLSREFRGCIERELFEMKHALFDSWSFLSNLHFHSMDQWWNLRFQQLIHTNQQSTEALWANVLQERRLNALAMDAMVTTLHASVSTLDKLMESGNRSPCQCKIESDQLDRSALENAKQERNEFEETIQSLKLALQDKSHVESDLQAKIKEFELQQIRTVEPEFHACGPCYVDGFPTPFHLEATVKATMEAISTFCDCLEKCMHDPLSGKIVNTNSPEMKNYVDKQYVTRHAHAKFAIKAYVSVVIFHGFENETFLLNGGLSLSLDPDKLKGESLQFFQGSRSNASSPEFVKASAKLFGGDALFQSFCEERFQRILPKRQLRLQFGDSIVVSVKSADGRKRRKTARTDGLEAETNVASSFLAAAQRVWALQKLCLSFDSPATIFRVGKGTPVDGNYMESVVELQDDEKFVNDVGFMIFPGFRLSKSIVKCQIYLDAK